MKAGEKMNKYEWVKMNNEPIEIERVADEHEQEKDYMPSFWFNNRRYYLDDFLRAHNNPWVVSDFPDFIHGIESSNYYNPLFIELIADEFINVWAEKEV